MQQETLPSRKILREGKYIRESSAFFNPRGQVRPLVSKISWRQEQSRDAGRKWKGLAMRGLLFKDDFIRHRAFMTRFVDIIKIWKTDKVGDAKTKALKEKNGKVSIRYTLPLRGAAISGGRLGNPLEENREIQAVLPGVKYASRRPEDEEPIFENMAYLLNTSEVVNRIAKIPKVIHV